MDPKRWNRVMEILTEAWNREPEERAEFLEQACAGDPRLRGMVDTLLAADEASNELLDNPEPPPPIGPEAPTVIADEGLRPGEHIGHYHLLQRIGEGGMGEVWLAEQTEPVKRRVALKVIKRGMDSDQVVARFEAERQALAMMDHACVAKVFEAGTTPRGRPYFAMEYVKGVPITEHCDRQRLSTRARLELFRRVCNGVHHAHQKGIIHRDIKPTNVLVQLQDHDRIPKIIDFGVAKATAQRLTERTLFTELGQLIGTPEYMSPEQAEMTSEDIDTRTDVYSLGVLLYELLVGSLPFDPRELRRGGFDEIRRRIREEEPSRPSTRISTLGDAATDSARSRKTNPSSLERQLRGDLDWITMKALEKDRARRYDSASDLAQDIGRFMQHEPVEAGPPSAAYRARKFVRRHRIGVGVSAVLALSTITFAILATIGFIRVSRAEEVARFEADTSTEVIDFMVELFEISDPGEARGNEVTAREILDRGVESIEDELVERPDLQARLLEVMGLTYRKLGLYGQALPLLEQAIEDRRRVLGNSPELADSLNDVASVLLFQRRAGDALPLLEEARAIQDATLATDDLRRAKTLNNLGNVARLERRREDALDYYLKGLAVREAALGPDDPELIGPLSNIASLQLVLGHEDEALKLYERAIAIAEAGLPPNHPDLGRVLNNLGTLHRRAERFTQAREVLERAVSIQEQSLGAEHRLVLTSLFNLGETYVALGEDELAATVLRRVVVDERHPRVERASERLSEVLARLGRGEETRTR